MKKLVRKMMFQFVVGMMAALASIGVVKAANMSASHMIMKQLQMPVIEVGQESLQSR